MSSVRVKVDTNEIIYECRSTLGGQRKGSEKVKVDRRGEKWVSVRVGVSVTINVHVTFYRVYSEALCHIYTTLERFYMKLHGQLRMIFFLTFNDRRSTFENLFSHLCELWKLS